MRQTTSSRILRVTLLVMALAPFPILAQEAAPTFGETLDVRVVNIEAVVTEKGGTRVLGLTPDDFRLRVDGDEVRIEFFTEFRGGQALRDVGASPWDIAPISDAQARGTSYLVFIDDFFTLRVDRDRVLEALEAELALLGPDDRMAIVAWDGGRTEMLSTWSSNQSELRRTLQAAVDRSAGGLKREAERRTILSGAPLPRATRGFGGRGLTITERAYADILVDQLERAVDAAGATLRGFAAPPGRKVMLLVSGGWPFRPVEFITGNAFVAALEPSYERGEEIYGPLVETANLLGYTLYPIDAPGLAGESRFAAIDRAALPRVVGTTDDREFELHDSLRFLARETGGRALINGQRVEPLSRVAADTRSFYWIGFSPERSGDGEVRSIELEVKQKGLKVRARGGYRDLSIAEEVSMQVASALRFGFPAHAHGLSVELGSSRRDRRRTMIVPLTVRLPASSVALLPADGGYVADLEVRIAAIDERGDTSEVTTVTWPVARERPPADDEALEFATSLRLRRAAQDVVVAVYDANSGELFSATSSVLPAS